MGGSNTSYQSINRFWPLTAVVANLGTQWATCISESSKSALQRAPISTHNFVPLALFSTPANNFLNLPLPSLHARNKNNNTKVHFAPFTLLLSLCLFFLYFWTIFFLPPFSFPNPLHPSLLVTNWSGVFLGYWKKKCETVKFLNCMLDVWFCRTIHLEVWPAGMTKVRRGSEPEDKIDPADHVLREKETRRHLEPDPKATRWLQTNKQTKP